MELELKLGVGVVCSNCNTTAATYTTPIVHALAGGAPEDADDDLDLELRLGVSSSSFHHTHVYGRVHEHDM
jgi:hypothetical protein